MKKIKNFFAVLKYEPKSVEHLYRIQQNDSYFQFFITVFALVCLSRYDIPEAIFFCFALMVVIYMPFYVASLYILNKHYMKKDDDK